MSTVLRRLGLGILMSVLGVLLVVFVMSAAIGYGTVAWAEGPWGFIYVIATFFAIVGAALALITPSERRNDNSGKVH